MIGRRAFIGGLLATPVIARAGAVWVPPRRVIRPVPLFIVEGGGSLVQVGEQVYANGFSDWPSSRPVCSYADFCQTIRDRMDRLSTESMRFGPVDFQLSFNG